MKALIGERTIKYRTLERRLLFDYGLPTAYPGQRRPFIHFASIYSLGYYLSLPGWMLLKLFHPSMTRQTSFR